MNYTKMLRNHARNRPRHSAILEVGNAITYATLDRLVDAAAARLMQSGMRQGDIAAVALGDNAEHLIVFFAVLRIGAIFYGVSPAAGADELRQDIEAVGARWFVAEAGRSAPDGTDVIGVDASWRMANPMSALPVDMPDDPALPAYLVPTSGTSSGKARAVMFTHGDMATRLQYSQMNMGYGPWDRYASLVPLAFNVGRIHFVHTLQSGGTALFLPDSLALASLPLILARNRVSWMFITPHHLRNFLRSIPRADTPALGGLRQLVVGSSVLTAQERADARQFLSPNLIEQYGTAQCGLHSTSGRLDQLAAPDSVGRIVIGSEAEIVDSEDRPLPAGATGEIRLRGPGFPTGYYRDPEASARAFRNGWFYPGDLAAIDENGYLHLKGRVDDMFIFDGYNIFPDEIEAVLARHPQIEEVAIVSQRTDLSQELPVAFVVTRSAIASSELHRYCASQLTQYKRPRAFYFVPSLPKNDMGKVLRRELRSRLPVIVSSTLAPLSSV